MGRRALQSIAIDAEPRLAAFHVGDAIELDGRGALDRYVDQLPSPFLAAAALDQQGFRPVLVLAHCLLLNAARRTGTNLRSAAGLAAADQSDQTVKPTDAPRE